jgi:aldose 1-epimerase
MVLVLVIGEATPLYLRMTGGEWKVPEPKENNMGPKVEGKIFGKMPDGTPIEIYALTNSKGMQAKVTNYGAILTELNVPDRNSNMTNVVMGFDNLESYLAGHPMFGATCGRVANRVAKGKFTLDGKEYQLAINNGPNSLHGGLKGFDKKVWKVSAVSGADDKGHEYASAKFTCTSPDGDEGYPGNLDVTVTYTVNQDNALEITYLAVTDKATPVNLTNHSYFNLSAFESSAIRDQELTLAADNYTPFDDTQIPIGKIEPVKGTPLDFTKPTAIGARIDQVGGYDHNFVINRSKDLVPFAARVYDPKTGRVMEMFTSEPGVQLYTANGLDGKLKGHGGVAYKKYGGFCLEAQHYPDSVNQPTFPSVILKPDEKYRQTTIYKFSTK